MKKKLIKKLKALTIVISHLMCIVVAFDFRDMICGIEHMGYSAPAWVSFLWAIPFIVINLIIWLICNWIEKKDNKGVESKNE